MIVRNGATTLPACLQSVVALCEELVVVDSGSDDTSREIARSFGARVVQAPWTNDFSVARNVYLKKARCSWVLSLDADEILGKVSKTEFINALERHPYTAFMFRIRNYFFEGDVPEPTLPSKLSTETPAGVRCVISRTVRLFPRLPRIKYSYPIHESLLPAIKREDLRVKQCGIPIHHIGHLHNREKLRAKVALYQALGQKKIADFPRYFPGYLELGKLYLQQARLGEAERMFKHGIRLRPTCVEAHCYLAFTMLRQGRHADCGELLRRLLRHFPDNPDAIYLLQMLYGTKRSITPDSGFINTIHAGAPTG